MVMGQDDTSSHYRIFLHNGTMEKKDKVMIVKYIHTMCIIQCLLNSHFINLSTVMCHNLFLCQTSDFLMLSFRRGCNVYIVTQHRREIICFVGTVKLRMYYTC